MLVHRRVTLQHFAGTHLYTLVERGTVRVKCLAQEHNAVPRPRLEPGPLDPEPSALTIRPVNHETRKLTAVIDDLLFLIAMNCAQDPPYGPSL